MIMTNERMIVELTNKAFIQIFGYSAQEIVGENIKVIIGDPALRARHDELVASSALVLFFFSLSLSLPLF